MNRNRNWRLERREALHTAALCLQACAERVTARSVLRQYNRTHDCNAQLSLSFISSVLVKAGWRWDADSSTYRYSGGYDV